MTRVLTVLLVMFPVMVCGTGCGGKPAAPDPKAGRMIALFELYSVFQKAHQNPPKQPSDLMKQEYEAMYPEAVQALRGGDLLVAWGTPVGGNEILIYEKDAPQNGGAVLLANGSSKNVSAADVQAAAPKAAAK